MSENINTSEKQEVNHPSYYKGSNGIEAIDVIEAASGFDGALHFCRGSAIKYLFRAGNKKGNSALQDFRKVRWYVNKVIEMLEKSNEGIYPEEALDSNISPDSTQSFTVSIILHKNIRILNRESMTPEEVAAIFEKKAAEANLNYSVDNVSAIKNEN